MLNKTGAMRRQSGSMVLMVIFVMILFGFLAASLARFSVEQDTASFENTDSTRAELAARSAMEMAMYALYPAGRYYGWNAEVPDGKGYKDCDRLRNIDADGSAVRAGVDGNIQNQILHGGVKIFLCGGVQPMDFIYEEHISRLEIGQKACQIAFFFNSGAAGHVKADAEFLGNNVCQ